MNSLLGIIKKKNITFIDVLSLIGGLLWVSAIFLRGTDIMQNEIVGFLIGIAPNFGVGLMLPAFALIYYPIIFKKNITFNKFILILIAIYILLFVSELVHDKFLNSRFDLYDMTASLIALGIMALAYKFKKVSN